MAVNKVEYAGTVLLDLTSDTVTANDMVEGATAHNKSGEIIRGTIPKRESTDIVFDGNMGHAIVTPGYYENQVTQSIPLETKDITENGTYTPSENNSGFSSVTVNVPVPSQPHVAYGFIDTSGGAGPKEVYCGFRPIHISIIQDSRNAQSSHHSTYDANANNIRSDGNKYTINGTTTGSTRIREITDTGFITYSGTNTMVGLWYLAYAPAD